MEIIVSFAIGFIFSWFLFKTDVVNPIGKFCPNKETISKLAEEKGSDKKIMREIRGYSLIQIQQGHYEYADVLNILRKKEVHDKV